MIISIDIIYIGKEFSLVTQNLNYTGYVDQVMCTLLSTRWFTKMAQSYLLQIWLLLLPILMHPTCTCIYII